MLSMDVTQEQNEAEVQASAHQITDGVGGPRTGAFLTRSRCMFCMSCSWLQHLQYATGQPRPDVPVQARS